MRRIYIILLSLFLFLCLFIAKSDFNYDLVKLILHSDLNLVEIASVNFENNYDFSYHDSIIEFMLISAQKHQVLLNAYNRAVEGHLTMYVGGDENLVTKYTSLLPIVDAKNKHSNEQSFNVSTNRLNEYGQLFFIGDGVPGGFFEINVLNIANIDSLSRNSINIIGSSENISKFIEDITNFTNENHVNVFFRYYESESTNTMKNFSRTDQALNLAAFLLAILMMLVLNELVRKNKRLVSILKLNGYPSYIIMFKIFFKLFILSLIVIILTLSSFNLIFLNRINSISLNFMVKELKIVGLIFIVQIVIFAMWCFKLRFSTIIDSLKFKSTINKSFYFLIIIEFIFLSGLLVNLNKQFNRLSTNLTHFLHVQQYLRVLEKVSIIDGVHYFEQGEYQTLSEVMSKLMSNNEIYIAEAFPLFNDDTTEVEGLVYNVNQNYSLKFFASHINKEILSDNQGVILYTDSSYKLLKKVIDKTNCYECKILKLDVIPKILDFNGFSQDFRLVYKPDIVIVKDLKGSEFTTTVFTIEDENFSITRMKKILEEVNANSLISVSNLSIQLTPMIDSYTWILVNGFTLFLLYLSIILVVVVLNMKIYFWTRAELIKNYLYNGYGFLYSIGDYVWINALLLIFLVIHTLLRSNNMTGIILFVITIIIFNVVAIKKKLISDNLRKEDKL